MAGWNGTGSQGASFTSGPDDTQWYYLDSASAVLGTVLGHCIMLDDNGEIKSQMTGNGSPITVTLTINGVSASAVVSNVVGVTEGSSGNVYPVSAGQSYTFTFPSGAIKVDANTTVSGSASWSGVLSCSTGGNLGFSPSWRSEPKLVPVTRTVTLNANGGRFSNGYTTRSSSGTAMLMPGSTGPVSVNFGGEEPTWANHRFLGWYTAPVGGSKLTSTSVTLYGDATYYAHWSTYLTFDLDGGDYSFPEYWVELGGSINILNAIPIRPGFDFHSWYDDSTGLSYAPGAQYTFEVPKTLRARWVRRSISVEVYNNLISSQPQTHVVSFGQNIRLIPEQSQDKFRFVGWDTDEASSGIMKSQKINCLWDVADYWKRISGKWSRGFKPSANYVTYIYNGSIHTEFVEYGQDCLHPSITPIKDGCTFLGWTLDRATAQIETEAVMNAEPLLFYAVWEYPDITIPETAYLVSGSSGSVLGNTVIQINNERFSRITGSVIAECNNVPNAQTGSNYVYLMYTNRSYSNELISLTLGKQVVTLRGYRGAGSAGMIEDTTTIGYGGRAVEVEFDIPLEEVGYLVIAGGPNLVSDSITATFTCHGRRVTG